MASPRVLFVGRATLDVIYSLGQFPSEDSKTYARAIHVAPGGQRQTPPSHMRCWVDKPNS
jgi:hypothetical protein